MVSPAADNRQPGFLLGVNDPLDLSDDSPYKYTYK